MTIHAPVGKDWSMFKLFLLSLLFSAFPMSAMASKEQPMTSSKTEIELKINLTKAGYNKLKSTFLQKYKGEESSRSDFYFDIFKNDSYQLKTAQPPLKIRFQWDASDLTWQTQKVLSSSVITIFTVKKTESISMDTPVDFSLIESIKNYHLKLDALDPYALTMAANIQASMEAKGIITFTQALCPQCTKEENFFSTHLNTKSRVKMKLKISEDQFSMQVGETNNRGIITYELEVEVKKSHDLEKSAESLHKWLTTNGLESTDIESSTAIDPTKDSEAKLRMLL